MPDRAHPDRPRTAITRRDTAALIVTDHTRPSVSQAQWIALKARQTLEDGTSARLTGARLSRLEAMPTHWPAPDAPPLCGGLIDPDPMHDTRPAAHQLEHPVDADAQAAAIGNRIARHPAVRRAVDQIRSALPTPGANGFRRLPHTGGDDAA